MHVCTQRRGILLDLILLALVVDFKTLIVKVFGGLLCCVDAH